MFFKMGHRGAAGLAPENTPEAFLKALEAKCNSVELDVHFINKKLYVLHDKEDLKKDTPVLEQIIDLVNRRAIINIELKGAGTAEPVALLIDKYIKKGWKRKDFMVSSFRFEELKNFKKAKKGIRLGLIIKKKNKDLFKILKDLKVFSVNISCKLAKKKFINSLKSQGFKVFVWTVNKKAKIRKLRLLKVDGIISDFPDSL